MKEAQVNKMVIERETETRKNTATLVDKLGLPILKGWYFNTDTGDLCYLTGKQYKGVAEAYFKAGRHDIFPAVTRTLARIPENNIKRYISEVRQDLDWAEEYQRQLEKEAQSGIKG